MYRSSRISIFDRLGELRAASVAGRVRRRWSGAALALIATSVAGGGVWTMAELGHSNVVEAATTTGQSLSEMLGHRSPGVRTQAELIKKLAARSAPRQRLAPKNRAILPPAKVAIPLAQLSSVAETPALVVLPGDLTAPPLAELVIGPPALPGGSVTVPGVVGPGGPPGSSAPGTPPASPPHTPVPVPSAVPEPATWFMMLLGFAMMGWRVRKSAATPRAA